MSTEFSRFLSHHQPAANSGTPNPLLCYNWKPTRCRLFSIIFVCRVSTLDCQFSTDSLKLTLVYNQFASIENIVPNNSSIVACVSVAAETFSPIRCLAMDVSSGSTIPAFRRHVTVLSYCILSKGVSSISVTKWTQ
jgi:hypothetical protein